ncbi:MAG: PEPxxWA-CTERM sorting domain-containing protein [Sphingomonadaceae bacterium]|nr:PEPxxWA-CTERM sorting domain-containing protein [Sphingomonadaceae bacterium]
MLRLLVLAAAVTAAPALAAPNLVVNGGFENAPLGVEQQYIGNQLPGWTIDPSIYRYADVYDANASTVYTTSYDGGGYGSDDRRLAASFAGVSPSGGNFFGVDGDPQYGSPLSQTISGLRVGHLYGVTFDWAASQLRNRQGPTTNQWLVSLGSDTRATPVVNVASQGFDGWYKTSFRYTATAGSEVLQFVANGTPAGLPPFALLDGVSLTAVPEPAAWALMLGGFGLIGAAARRRRTAVAA